MRKLTAYLVIRSPKHNHTAGAIVPLSPHQLTGGIFSGGQESRDSHIEAREAGKRL